MKRIGIVLPIFSLPSGPEGVALGDVGRYLEFLDSCGVHLWQILPLNPTDVHGSPYGSYSLNGGNLAFLDEALLEQEGLFAPGAFRFSALKEERLLQGLRLGEVAQLPGYREFRKKPWALATALYRHFMALYGTGDVRQWGEEGDFKRALEWAAAPEVEAHLALEFLFHRQWGQVMDFAHSLGISIVGDLPYYPGKFSVEAWAFPGDFKLEDGRILASGGVPPDGFSQEGQYWDTPVYDQEAMAQNGHAMWRERISEALERFDYVRLDHFRGLDQVFEIPAGKSPRQGHWQPVAGLEILEGFSRERLLAEDLGFLDESFHSFARKAGIRGMEVMVFEDGSAPPRPEKVYYTGNHDTESLAQFAKRAQSMDHWRKKLPQVNRAQLLTEALHRENSWVMVQHVDFFDGTEDFRINTPGTSRGNWRAKIGPQLMGREARDIIKSTVRKAGRK
ncbi:MAG: 4-alpha-glucanotransferase [Tissierellia bacterium]|nr:4-alpha-glucanotransferase [Tissierellia bacterium]